MNKSSKVFRVIGVERIWLTERFTRATEQQADAIAQGYIAGTSITEEKELMRFGPCSEMLARRAFRKWATVSPDYGSGKFEEIRFVG